MILATYSFVGQRQYSDYVEIFADREGLQWFIKELQRIVDSPHEDEHTHFVTERGGGYGSPLTELLSNEKHQLVDYLDVRLVPSDWPGFES